MTPCISVIVPAYNAVATIQRAIRSALREPEVGEVIVVDDASTDDTAAVAQAADDGTGRLRIHRLPRNSGPATARNTAIAMAHMPLFALLDADDVFIQGRFARLLATNGGDWDLVADNIRFVPEELWDPAYEQAGELGESRIRTIDFPTFVTSNIPRPFRLRGEMGFIKPLIRREMFEGIGLSYDASLHLGEDFVLYAQALLRGARLCLASSTGYIALQRGRSLSATHSIEDLRHLRKAVGEIGEEATRFGVPKRHAEALRRHGRSVDHKIDVRVLLEEARQDGRLAALIRRIGRPLWLAGMLLTMMTDRIAIRIGQGAEVRTLFQEADFVEGRAGGPTDKHGPGGQTEK